MIRLFWTVPVIALASPVAAQQADPADKAPASVAVAVLDGDTKPTESRLREPASELLARRKPAAAPDRVTFDTGARVVGKYISRGVAFSEEVSLQPYITLTVALPELSSETIGDVSWFAGNWNSFQRGGPGLGQENRGDLSGWYEADFYTGFSGKIRERWNVSFAYYYYHSPAHSFKGYSDLEWIVSYDDSGLWDGIVPLRDFNLAPALRVTQEVGRPGRKDALYVQPSVTASFNLSRTDNPIWMRVPLILGFSDNYYDGNDGGNEAFGYFRTGLTIAGAPFNLGGNPFMIGGGLDFWVLNDKIANGLDDTELVWRFGFRWAF